MKSKALNRSFKLMDKAHKMAVKARKSAYCPYSKYQVGAAVVCEDGSVFAGCNMENASYGATICAERVAIGQAVLAGQRKIMGVVVVTGSKDPAPPCGVCRQVISEFMDSSGWIAVGNLKKVIEMHSLDEILPIRFSSKNL